MNQEVEFKQWIQNAQEIESYIAEILKDYEALQEIEWSINSHLFSSKGPSILYLIEKKGDVLQKFSYNAYDYIHNLIRMFYLLEEERLKNEFLFSELLENPFEESKKMIYKMRNWTRGSESLLGF